MLEQFKERINKIDSQEELWNEWQTLIRIRESYDELLLNPNIHETAKIDYEENLISIQDRILIIKQRLQDLLKK